MSNVVQLLWHTVDEAAGCKKHFYDDYEMYVSWCAQFRQTTDGQHTRLIPISHEEYNNI
jgi:hypothetical protein